MNVLWCYGRRFALLLLMLAERFELFALTTAAPTFALFVPKLVTLAELLMLLLTRLAVELIAVLVMLVLRLFALLAVLFDAASPHAAIKLAASANPATVIDFLISISCLLKVLCSR